MFRQLVTVILLLVSFSQVSAQEAKLESIEWNERSWSIKYPDQLSGVVRFGDPHILGVMNRAYLQTPWEEENASLEFLWAPMLTKAFPTDKEQISYADHLLIHLRGKGEYSAERSFEPKDGLLLRILSGPGLVSLEEPGKGEGGASKQIASKKLEVKEGEFALAPNTAHSIEIVDSDNLIIVFVNKKEILREKIIPPGKGNVLSIGNRETNGGQNYSVLIAPKKK